jgi:hypothetical protein
VNLSLCRHTQQGAIIGELQCEYVTGSWCLDA